MNHKPVEFDLKSGFVLHLTQAQPRLLGFLIKRLVHLDQAQEVLQEVNLVMCSKAAEFEDGSDFMAWAFTIARLQVLAYRKRQVRDRLVFPDNLAEQMEELDSKMLSTEWTQRRESALQGCMKRLSDHHRDVVLKRYAESVSVKAIAAELGKTSNATSILLHRIRQQLLRCMESKLSKDSTP